MRRQNGVFMENQFSNQQASQNDAQTNYQNQTQPVNQQPNYGQTGYQQPVYQEQAYQQAGYQQPQQMYQPQQPQGIVVQIPVYSEEQLQMQEKIRADEFGLIKMRGKLRLEIIGYLSILIITILMTSFAFFQLLGQGYVSGTSLTRFLSSEIYILNTAYAVAFISGILAFIMLMVTFFQVRKVRVDSIFPFDRSMKTGIIAGAFTIAIVFFLSAFWLMMSLATYWLIFLLQAVVLVAAMIMTFRVVAKAERTAQIARKNNLKMEKKPVAESIYYTPVSYRDEVHYPEQQAQQAQPTQPTQPTQQVQQQTPTPQQFQ